MTAILELHDVSKTYVQGNEKLTVLDHVSMRVNPGEFGAILGPSGSGKSTLLSIIGALTSPSSGEVKMNGRNVHNLSEKEQTSLRLKEIGFIFQQSNLVPFLTVEEQLVFVGKLNKQGDVLRKRAGELLSHLGLAERRSHYPEQLSGGEQQRVAIARALMNEPRLILADEPTASLDQARGKSVVELLATETKERNIATIMVTHDEMMIGHCDWVYRMT
ncbi:MULTISPECIES: ABC transporter ATP-binding protein [Rossellomorea]|jgi:putative ABC transport system ATP-binding protein|uniref:Putative hemin import ATP-binding protein HrtA n=1 Tax=Rossellomorea aquimaris TaxID=189382 RepID=A0A5D4UPC7_9BACI|nr:MULTISPECIES: ABC transporter ATP-binding protein [Rossellomorea]MDT9027078.1 ABC transporter ATP-binding protein [Rossellomorea sp. YC4-1]TYS82097.1 ABC transporter ATP-binding protein [Rossellomorea aquimaris]TYS88721.1 ABC transporter ATP-binding protein [Rossellomorea aquimaris]